MRISILYRCLYKYKNVSKHIFLYGRNNHNICFSHQAPLHSLNFFQNRYNLEEREKGRREKGEKREERRRGRKGERVRRREGRKRERKKRERRKEP